MQAEKHVAILDFGSSKISLCVSKISPEISDDGAQVVFYEQCPSDGISMGNIFNSTKVSNQLSNLITKAEEALNTRVSRVLVNYPRYKVKCINHSQKFTRNSPNDYITSEEIKNLKEFIKDGIELHDREEIYGILAQSYSTEDAINLSESDIIGSTGDFVEINVLVFVGSKKFRSNIEQILSKLKIDCLGFDFAPIYESYSILNEDEREHGAALIEIGADITSVSVYHKGVMRYYHSFPFGGSSVSEDIHNECNIEKKLAENIKLSWGYCMPDKLLTMSDKSIHVKGEQQTQRLPVKYLSEIVNARVKEIFTTCLYLIYKSGYADKLRKGIVLCGGAAQSLQCDMLLNSMAGLHCRVAIPRLLNNSSDNAQEALIYRAISASYDNCTDTSTTNKPQETGNPLEEEKELPSGSLFSDDEIEVIPPEDKNNSKTKEAKKEKSKIGKGLGKKIGNFLQDQYSAFGGLIFEKNEENESN